MMLRTDVAAAQTALTREVAIVVQRLRALEGKVDALPQAIADHGHDR